MRVSLRDRWSRRVGRFRNRSFLDAAMAAAALVASAGPEIRLAEQLALDEVLERLDQLRVYDAHTGVDLHQLYVKQLQADPELGLQQVLDSIRAFRGDPDRGMLILYVAAFVARADGELSEPDRFALGHIADALGLALEPALQRIWGEPAGRA